MTSTDPTELVMLLAQAMCDAENKWRDESNARRPEWSSLGWPRVDVGTYISKAQAAAAALTADGPAIVDDGTVTQVERVPRMGAEADGSVTRNLTKNEYPPDTRPLYVPKEDR